MICPSRSSGASERATAGCALPPVTTMMTSAPSTAAAKIGRRALDRGKASGFHIDAAMRADLGKPRVVEIVQPQPMPGQAQLGHEIDAADPRADDRDRAHAITPDWRRVPSVSLS